MARTNQIHKLSQLLAGRRTAVPLSRIMEELECSRATANRLISTLRIDYNAPIRYDREQEGYILDRQLGAVQLPGVWFDEKEITALLTMDRLFQQLGSDFLSRLLAPAREHIAGLLEQKGIENDSVRERIRIVQHMNRQTSNEAFEVVAAATIQRLQLEIHYHGRGNDQKSVRKVSPQRLLRYRDNWYLDAWCHQSDAMRRFSLDRITQPNLLDKPALELSPEELSRQLDGGYGAFAGPAKHTARLVFSAKIARWVADEHWHDDQVGEFLPDGRYQLDVPYAYPEELLMDVLRFGQHVLVHSPIELLEQVKLEAQLLHLNHHCINGVLEVKP